MILMQNNVWSDDGYKSLVSSLREWTDVLEVYLPPFTSQFHVEGAVVRPEIPSWVFGSVRFVEVCRELGYPICDSPDPLERFGLDDSLWVNPKPCVMKWGDLGGFLSADVFVKPCREKFFTGQIISSVGDLEKVQLGGSEDEVEELVLVSDPVKLWEEVRFFVIGGKITTASMYRMMGNLSQCSIFGSSPVWQFASGLIPNLPNNVVLDLGLTQEGWKIVELNNLNSSGLYSCNPQAISLAIRELSVN